MGVAERPVLNEGSSGGISPNNPLGAAKETLLGADLTSTPRMATNTIPLLRIFILLVHVIAGV